MEHLMVQQ
jgi:hypothetical protein